MQQEKIYLDYNATTPIDPRVLEVMIPFEKEHFGNSASVQHTWGWAAQSAVENARKHVATLIGCDKKEVIFNSGATEGNNHILFSLFHQHLKEIKENSAKAKSSQPFHIITTKIEHNSIYKCAKYLETLGAEVDFIGVDHQGFVNLQELKQKIRPTTKLISCIWVNNEVGTIQDIQAIGNIARENKIYFHTDATQAIGKIKINLKTLPVDLLTFSGHKIYGPKGIGAMFLRAQNPHVQLDPLLIGGGHEKGLRSGTLNTPAIVGLGKACEICFENYETEPNKLYELRKFFVESVLSHIPGTSLNGPDLGKQILFSSPITMSITFPQTIEPKIGKLVNLGISMGSACSSNGPMTSHVLNALGLTQTQSESTIRFSIGRMTTKEELQQAVEILVATFVEKNTAKASELRV